MRSSSTTFSPPDDRGPLLLREDRRRGPFLAKFSASADTPTTSRSPIAGPLQHPEVTDVEHVEGAEGDDGATH